MEFTLPILGKFKFVKKADAPAPKKEFSSGEGLRPDSKDIKAGIEGEIPAYNISREEIRIAAKTSSELQTVFTTHKTQLFRNGLVIEEAYTSKCVNCGKEFETDPEQCDECKGAEFLHPSITQKKNLEKWMERVNKNEETILDLLEAVEDSINEFDDHFILQAYRYAYESGKVIAKNLIEHVSLDPAVVYIMADKAGNYGRDENGRPVYVCFMHRNQVQHSDTCGHCGRAAYPIWYFAKCLDGKSIYYAKEEIIHNSFYKPSLTGGTSPIVQLYQTLLLMAWQKKRMVDVYKKARVPGVLFVRASNGDDLEANWNKLILQNKSDPLGVWPMAATSDSAGPLATFIKLFDSVGEMAGTELRNEARREIFARYGLTPIFSGDISVSGGLNNESQQLNVADYIADRKHRMYEDKVFPRMLEAIGVTDYVLKFKPTKTIDEAKEANLKLLKDQHAQNMKSLGFKVTLNEEEEFEFDEEPETHPPGLPPPLANPFPPAQGNVSDERFAEEPVQKAMDRELLAEISEVVDKAMAKLGYSKLKRLDESQVRKLAVAVQESLTGKGRRLLRSEIRRIYQDEVRKVERELDRDIVFTDTDETMIDALKDNVRAQDAFKSLESGKVSELENIVIENYARPGFTIEKLAESLKGVVEGSESRMQTIARTESSRVANLARTMSYKKADPESTAKYKWLSIPDSRRSDVCRNISSRTAHGVTMSELVQIASEEAKKSNPKWAVDDRNLVPHCSCRSVVVKVR